MVTNFDILNVYGKLRGEEMESILLKRIVSLRCQSKNDGLFLD